jgi:hypothetical protein
VLIQAAAFSDYVLAIHIVAVMAAFGVVFSYPVFVLVGLKLDPSKAPWFHRMQAMIGQRLINPGLAVVLLAGIYLASDLHRWKEFFVQWGLAAVVVIGGLEGAVMIKGEKRLAELAERDLAAGGDGTAGESGSAVGSSAQFQFSEEYQRLLSRLSVIGGLLVLIIVVTIFMMVIQP